jgi:hypothetical protein
MLLCVKATQGPLHLGHLITNADAGTGGIAGGIAGIVLSVFMAIKGRKK